VPVAECLQQCCFSSLCQIIRRKSADKPNRGSHLFEVFRTTVAIRDMRFERTEIMLVERSFEVVRDELDELLAAEGFGIDHAISGVR